MALCVVIGYKKFPSTCSVHSDDKFVLLGRENIFTSVKRIRFLSPNVAKILCTISTKYFVLFSSPNIRSKTQVTLG